MPQPPKRSLPHILLLVIILSALLTWAFARAVPGARPGPIVGNVLFGLAALVHSTYLMGWKRTLAFFTLACGLGFSMEMLSAATGLATPYYYTAVLGARLGGVPLMVPLGWYFMMYSSHCLVNLVAEGHALSTRGGTGWTLLLGLLTALVMTAWDLTADPFMVHKVQAWVWVQGGPYLGIPLANYVSWVETSFIIAIACRLADRALSARTPTPPAPEPGRWWEVYPVAIYAVVGLSAVFIGYPPATQVISPFSMGLPVLAALTRIWNPEGSEA